ncbi:MAG: 23S rRNA (guanosine(2251)-2'-O)-methyltransferase RlmB [Legionellaceae bacterium]|nr:23S rRNA (guanosine(2251)-2'-O)-methyltransferase RlmB [Legionellaceae bacterium]
MTDQLVYGIHAVAALLHNQHRTVKKLIVNQEGTNSRIQELCTIAKSNHVSIELLSTQKMSQHYADIKHQGIIAYASPLPQYSEHDIPHLLSLKQTPALILILDGITDPHNLGACLRSADGAGVDFVIIPKDKNATVTAVVSKVACGAAESIPILRVTNLARTMETLKQEGIWIYGAAGEATQSLYEIDYKGSVAFVMGAEGDGMRRLTQERCDNLIALPMLGTVTSLNVSVAAGICLYEAVRQRAAK